MAVPLAQVVGRNARQMRLDAGVTLEQFGAASRPYGLSWSTGRVGDFENGRVAPALATLCAVALTLRDLTGQPVRLADLFAGDEAVELNKVLTIPLDSLRSAVNGLPVGYERDPAETVTIRVVDAIVVAEAASQAAMFALARESDFRLARDLGVTPNTAFAVMDELWRKPFSAERDERAGADANAQRKGQVSRQLKAELRKALAEQQGPKDKKTRGR